ncbi:hypothetical protein VTK56DRAFT_9007 [Thermocarpiscus australiensis]
MAKEFPGRPCQYVIRATVIQRFLRPQKRWDEPGLQVDDSTSVRPDVPATRFPIRVIRLSNRFVSLTRASFLGQLQGAQTPVAQRATAEDRSLTGKWDYDAQAHAVRRNRSQELKVKNPAASADSFCSRSTRQRQASCVSTGHVCHLVRKVRMAVFRDFYHSTLWSSMLHNTSAL